MMVRRWLLFFLLAIGVLPTMLCAQKEFEKENRGDWSVALPLTPKLTGDLSTAERVEATVWINNLLGLFHQMPLLADPRGFRVIVYAAAHPDDLDDDGGAGRATHAIGALQFNLASYEKTANGIEPVESDSAASIQIAVNDLVPVFGAASAKTGSDQIADFRLGIPKPDGTIHDFPVYNRWVVIQKKDAPLFAPVTRGDYLKYELSKAEAGLAELQKRGAAVDAQSNIVDQLKRQSAEISPDDAKLAATLSDTDETGAVQFASPDDTSATPVVTFNPALFDPSASRAAPRILAIKFDTDDANWPDILTTIDDQLDWQGLRSLLQ